MTYLDEIRAKHVRREPLNDIEQTIFDYYWLYPAKHKEQAERAAQQYIRIVLRNLELETNAALESRKE